MYTPACRSSSSPGHSSHLLAWSLCMYSTTIVEQLSCGLCKRHNFDVGVSSVLDAVTCIYYYTRAPRQKDRMTGLTPIPALNSLGSSLLNSISTNLGRALWDMAMVVSVGTPFTFVIFFILTLSSLHRVVWDPWFHALRCLLPPHATFSWFSPASPRYLPIAPLRIKHCAGT